MLEFDENWYLRAYPQAAAEIAAGIFPNARKHYEQRGNREALSPNAFFDEAWYRETYPDVRDAVEAGSIVNGYSHYRSSGAGESRNPNAWFEEAWYRSAYPEVADAIRAGKWICGYQHYLAEGSRQGCSPNPFLLESWRRARPNSHPQGYTKWLEENGPRRKREYPAKEEMGLISLVTSAYNTPIEYLRLLAESVVVQDFGVYAFEWVVLDNGSTDPATVAELQLLSRRSFVRLYRVERNLGIMGGMRYAVRRAVGRYVVPVDSDDYLYPDAVRILASSIQKHGYPALLYSDEDKVEGDEYFEAYLKPAWDPVLFFHSCYIAHLDAIDRGLAMMLDAYSDDRSRGCHDWDTFMRFYLAGYQPQHVPEVLYSWRRHPGSCAGDIASKDYIHDSHRNTLQRFLDAAPQPERYHLDYSPLFQRTPDWRIIRHSEIAPTLATVVLARSGDTLDRKQLGISDESVVKVVDFNKPAQSLLAALPESDFEPGLIRFICSGAKPLYEDWLAESLTFFELFPDTVMVGGPVYDEQDQILVAGMFFGFAGACGCPDRSRPRHDPGYFAQMWKPHSVSAVSAQHLVVDESFLRDALISGRIPDDLPITCLGEWLGAVASRWNKRTVYSPFLGVRSQVDWHGRWTEDETARFVEANRDLIPETVLYSRHLGLSMDRAYLPVMPDQRLSSIPQSLVHARVGANRG